MVFVKLTPTNWVSFGQPTLLSPIVLLPTLPSQKIPLSSHYPFLSLGLQFPLSPVELYTDRAEQKREMGFNGAVSLQLSSNFNAKLFLSSLNSSAPFLGVPLSELSLLHAPQTPHLSLTRSPKRLVVSSKRLSGLEEAMRISRCLKLVPNSIFKI